MSPGARDARLTDALRPFLAGPDRSGGVLLAVSGGPDSTALLHAAATLGAAVPIHAATIDHRLRPEAAEEARAVGRLARTLGLDHATLVWDAPHPASGLQAAARAARYRLLADCARRIGAGLVLTAHNADDQAETVLMRLIAGSGPAGLAGMRTERPLSEGVRLARPFLGLPKSDLVGYCERHGLPFVADPANADDRFARARLRRLLPRLAREGLSAARLCALAGRIGRDQAALDAAAEAALRQMRRPSEPGAVVLDGARLRAEPEAIVLRVLDTAIAEIAGALAARVPEAAVPPRLERLERLVLGALLPALAEGRALRRTLRGVLVEATRDGEVRLSPAPPRRPVPLPRPGSPEASPAAAASDPQGTVPLLGKGPGAAYIDDERVEHAPVDPGRGSHRS